LVMVFDPTNSSWVDGVFIGRVTGIKSGFAFRFDG